MKFIAIMAGGVGSRFWPASREALPKQFLDILGTGKSLLRLTYERSLKIVPNENILIVTNARYKPLVQEHLPELPIENILCEPSRNNTAPCVAYTALRIKAMDENGVMAILPSDHVILKEDEFVSKIERAMDFAGREQALVTLGIQPSRPDTGYGYIELDADRNDSDTVVKVNSFREKPNLSTAESYLASGDYVWNAGIFIWSVSSILAAYQNHAAQIVEVLTTNESAYGTPDEQDYINEQYPKTEKISVDYAIMEKAENVFTIPADIGWSDLGTWTSLHALLEKDQQQNVALGQILASGSKNCLIKSGVENKLMVVEGLEDFIVIDEKDVLLIWPKSREQEIKALRQSLENNRQEDYL